MIRIENGSIETMNSEFTPIEETGNADLVSSPPDRRTRNSSDKGPA